MPDELPPCVCGDPESEHDNTDGLSLTSADGWNWVEASRCHQCPCMRYREQVEA